MREELELEVAHRQSRELEKHPEEPAVFMKENLTYEVKAG
jgi:hypothetical protein